MNLEAIKALATSKVARQVLQTQKHSPKILFAAGTIGVVTATVLACRATLKISDVLDEHEKNLVDINAKAAHEEGQRTEVNKLQLRTGLEIAKLYSPAIGIGVVSIAALTGSHVILSKRNGAVMAAYAALDRGYKEYRQRVTDTYGKDVDLKFATGAEEVVVEERLADGKIKTTPTTGIKKNGRYGGSPYAVVFDEKSKFFSKEPGMNSNIVMMKQNWANDKLKAHGHLFLNEVYDMLDLPRTKAGAVVGWVYDPKNNNHQGDNYVSFGVFDGDVEWVEAFIDGDEKYAVLDFNVDGVILDLI